MRISFITPLALALLVLLVPIWALAFVGPRRVARWRQWASLALRTVAVFGLVLGLAGAQLVRAVGAVTTVFLLDGSDSVALSQRARAETFIQQALATMPKDDRAGVVVFGQRALVERTPGSDRAFGQVAALPGGAATNIEDAVQLGLALLPAEGYQRLVLLTDGGENRGDAVAAARVAATRGVPLDVVALTGQADGLDAQVSGVQLPAAARVGQKLPMQITLDSTVATKGTLTVQGPGGVTLIRQPVDVAQGTTQLDVTIPETLPAFNRYVVRLDVPNDARPENNAAEAYSFVSGQPRVLLIEGSAGEARNLAEALKAAQLDVTTVAPAQTPAGLADLSAYDAVALVNVPRRAMSDRALTALSAYVHDLGRGLLMVGGEQSFGAGAWRSTPVEAALPVTMDIPARYAMPPVSIVVLVDVSGSMGADEGGRPKIALAADGAARIATLLRDDDELTVIPYDTASDKGYQKTIGPIPGSRRDEAIEALRGLGTGGGGIDIHDGLEEAAKRIRASQKPVRHIITLTDGGDTTQQEGALDLIRQLRDEKVTVTTIAIGDGSDVPFLRDAARVGGGRTFLTDKASNLPTILSQETQVVLQPYIVEENFTPELAANSPILRGISAAPQLRGYVLTTPRQSAQVLLASPKGDAVLVAWQFGLGRALAWTSDFKGQWGRDWVAWDGFPRFAAQLAGWLLPRQDGQKLTLQATSSGAELVLTAQAQDDGGRPQPGLTLAARLLGGGGDGQELALREIAPGQYRATVSGARPGAYLVQLSAQDGRGTPFGAVTAGAVVPRSAEYQARGANPALLDALTRGTGGRRDPLPAAAFDANSASRGAVQEIGLPLLWLALLLLPLDIAVRRLVFRGQKSEVRSQKSEVRSQKSEVRSQEPEVRSKEPETQNSKLKTQNSKPPPPDLDKLREAQERARRRARGEE